MDGYHNAVCQLGDDAAVSHQMWPTQPSAPRISTPHSMRFGLAPAGVIAQRFFRSKAFDKSRSVPAGTSPTTVIHQSPWRRISVWVAPRLVNMGRV
jgi:hypothetical protein